MLLWFTSRHTVTIATPPPTMASNDYDDKRNAKTKLHVSFGSVRMSILRIEVAFVPSKHVYVLKFNGQLINLAALALDIHYPPPKRIHHFWTNGKILCFVRRKRRRHGKLVGNLHIYIVTFTIGARSTLDEPVK